MSVNTEALREDGTLVYVVRPYFATGYLSVTRTHAAYQAAAQQAVDWMDWSKRISPRFR